MQTLSLSVERDKHLQKIICSSCPGIRKKNKAYLMSLESSEGTFFFFFHAGRNLPYICHEPYWQINQKDNTLVFNADFARWAVN